MNFKIMRWSTSGYVDTNIRVRGRKRAEKELKKISTENNSNLYCLMKVEGYENVTLNLIFAEEARQARERRAWIRSMTGGDKKLERELMEYIKLVNQQGV